MKRSGVLLALVLVAAASSCVSSTTSPEGSGSPSAAPTSITVHGAVNVSYGNASDGITCALRVESANPVSVAFTDASGTLLATHQVNLVAGAMLSAGPCSGSAKYRLSVPEQDLYQVEVSGKVAATVSLTDLQASDLTIDVHV